MTTSSDDVWEQVLQTPHFPYPWSGLTEFLRSSLPLVGYGSLLNQTSAQRTIRAGTRRLPVLAFGGQRVFDYVMPVATQQRYGGESRDAKAIGVLNVHPTGSRTDWFNGVLTDVPVGDIPALRERELNYDLVPVMCVGYPTEVLAPTLAYTLACPRGSPSQDATLRPHRAYLELCLEGARSISPEFERLFLESTYLADTRTLLRAWL
jgi:hypothetical protein